MTAMAQDEGVSTDVGSALCALVPDAGGQRSGGAAPPVPGALGRVDLDGFKTDVIASIREAPSNAPKYASDTQAARTRRNRDAGLGLSSSGARKRCSAASTEIFVLRVRT